MGMNTKSLHRLSVLLALAVGSVGVSAEPFQQDGGPDGIVSIEAEHFDKNTPQGGHTWDLVTAPTGFTGTGAMQALPDNGANVNTGYVTDSPRLDYKVSFVKTGTIYVWVRAYGADGSSDSLHSSLDEQVIATADRISGFGTAYTWTNTAYEDPERIMFDVKTLGPHTFNLYMREDGAIVDKIVLTTNPNYRPTGDGPPESARGLPVRATNPSPESGATDVLHDVLLTWTASAFAQGHDVYLGTVLADVNAAGRIDPKGVLASQGQAGTIFDPPALLAFGTTYYWRIDEVNGAPDNTIFKGTVWSFTVEPYSYPLTRVTATASTAQNGMGPEKTVDGSGMTGDLHGNDPMTMWMSTGVGPNWIQYQLDAVYKLDKLLVWNSNQMIETFIGFGAKDVTVEYSEDGTTWTKLTGVPQFAQGTSLPGYAANTTVNFGGASARFVKLTINSTWGGRDTAGLAEVRFSYVPVLARGPQPANDAGNVKIGTTLNWRPGREAGSHKVYFGADRAAVANGTVAAQTVADHVFTPTSLNFGTTYYWKVDEVNTVTYPGGLWSFTTQPYQSVDDFESYDDKDNTIFDTWIDGVTDGKSGSQVGYNNSPFAEQTIIHGGKQSMPMAYDNSKTPFYSEATRTFDTVQNLTVNGADTLSLYFRGRPVGFADNGNNTFTMSSSGTDIWNNGDQFRFAYKTLTGDGTMVARVDSIVNTNVWAKAGVMIRQSVDAGSTHAFMPITPGGSGAGNGASFQHRLAVNGASTNADNPGAVVGPPYWVKIERKGNSFTGSISPDGKTWTQLGTAQTITMTGPVLIGLAVCSHDAALTTVAELSNVSTTGSVTGSWQAVAIGATMATNAPAPLYLTVTDKAGKSKTVVNPNPSASAAAAWTEWKIPLSSLTGVSLTTVQKLTIGVGDKTSPKAGGAGMLFVDDVLFGKPVQRVAAPGEILIEAETASFTAPMMIFGDVLASGGKAIGTLTTQADSSTNPPATGIAKIPFTVTGGKYKLLFWVFIPTDNDSLWVRIADATTQTKNHASGWVRFNNIPRGEYWHLVTVHSNDDGDQVVEWTLGAGAHTLEIAYREAGAQVDAVIIQPMN